MKNLVQILNQDQAYSERTQISLSPLLRQMVESKRQIKGESLSEYIRKAVVLRILAEEKDKKDRKEAAKIFVGSIKPQTHPEWRAKKDVIFWQRKLRAEKT